jgi:hypothetical protein
VTARPVALLLVAAAVAAYAGLALPARRAAADLGDEYRRVRERRRDASQRLSRTEHQLAARRSMTGGSAGQPPGEPLVSLRRAVLEAVKGSGVSNVRLSLSPGRAPVAASVHLSGEGRFEDVVRFTATVAPPGGTIVLDRVRFAPGPDTISLELDALSLEANP